MCSLFNNLRRLFTIIELECGNACAEFASWRSRDERIAVSGIESLNASTADKVLQSRLSQGSKISTWRLNFGQQAIGAIFYVFAQVIFYFVSSNLFYF